MYAIRSYYELPLDEEDTAAGLDWQGEAYGLLRQQRLQQRELLEIDLDADINQYLTHFRIPDTFDKPITTRQLLHYTAGLDNHFSYNFV